MWNLKVCIFQFGAETQQSKVAPSSAATRPIQCSREQVWRSRESVSSKAAGIKQQATSLWLCNFLLATKIENAVSPIWNWNYFKFEALCQHLAWEPDLNLSRVRRKRFNIKYVSDLIIISAYITSRFRGFVGFNTSILHFSREERVRYLWTWLRGCRLSLAPT